MDDPLEWERIQAEWDAKAAQWRGQKRSVTEADGINAANMARNYPNASPDSIAAFSTSGFRWDDPALSQILSKDAQLQAQDTGIIAGTFGWFTRPALAILEDGVRQNSRIPLTGLRMLQGESPGEALKNTGSGLVGQYIRAYKSGLNPTLGQGIAPGMAEDPLMYPGAGEELERVMGLGATLQEAQDHTRQWAIENVGYDVMRNRREDAETTMLHKTKNGVTISYQATPGGLVITPLTEWIQPNTAPHRFFTMIFDGAWTIGIDPANLPFDEATRAVISWNKAVPDVAEGIRQLQGMSDVQIAANKGAVTLQHRPTLVQGKVVNHLGNEVTDARSLAAVENPLQPWESIEDHVLHVGGDFLETETMAGGGLVTDHEIADIYWGDAAEGGVWNSEYLDDFVERTQDTVVSHKGQPMNQAQFEKEIAYHEDQLEYLWGLEDTDPELYERLKYQIKQHEDEMEALDHSFTNGRVLSGPGGRAGDAIPVAPPDAEVLDTATIWGTSEGQQVWDDLADDDWVTVYHIDESEIADAFVREGIRGKDKLVETEANIRSEKGQTGEGTYVGSEPEQLSMYATHDRGRGGSDTVLAIKVQKRDVLIPREAKGAVQATGTDQTYRTLGEKGTGAVITGDIPADNISIHSKLGNTEIQGPGRTVKGVQIGKLEDDLARMKKVLSDTQRQGVPLGEHAGQLAKDNYAKRLDDIEDAISDTTIELAKVRARPDDRLPVGAPDPNAPQVVIPNEPKIHIFKIDELPEAMQKLLRHPDQEGLLAQYISTPELQTAFPDMDLREIAIHTQQWQEAKRTIKSSRELVEEIDPQMADDIAVMIWRQETLEKGGDLNELSRNFTRYSFDTEGNIVRDFDGSILPTSAAELGEDLRYLLAVEEAGSTKPTVGELAQGWEDASKSIRENPVFGPNAPDGAKKVINRITFHSMSEGGQGFDPNTLIGGEGFSPTPSASYTRAEWEEMKEMGQVFTTRAEYDAYKDLQRGLQQAGASKVRGSWFVSPQTIDRFLGQWRGRRFIKWASSTNRTVNELYQVLPGMDLETVILIQEAHDPIATAVLLRDWYGSQASGRIIPSSVGSGKILRGVMPANASQKSASAQSRVSKARQRIGNLGERQTAQMGHDVIDPMDQRATIDYVVSRAKLHNVGPEELDLALRDIVKMKNYRTSKPIAERVWNWLGDDLSRKGYTEAEISIVRKQWNDTIEKSVQYANNAMGNEIPLGHGLTAKITTRHGTIEWPINQAVLDSQMHDRAIFMPGMRDSRRATSRMRAINEHYMPIRNGRPLVGLGTGKTQSVVDSGLAVWRNLALLRPGWILRVIPDEMGRFTAYGYGDLVENPLAIWYMSMGELGDKMPNGQSLRALIEQTGLGADNGMFRNMGTDTARGDKGTQVRGSNWNTLRAAEQNPDTGMLTLTDDGAKGVARVITQLYHSQLQRQLGNHGGDIQATFKFLREEKAGKEILRAIARRADPESFLGGAAHIKIKGAEDKLNHVLQTIEAQRHQYAGGAWVARTDEAGSWVNHYGQAVNTYTDVKYTREVLIREIGPVGPNGGLATGNLEELRALRMQKDGMPIDLMSRPMSDTVVITRNGDAELLDLMKSGRFRETPNPNEATRRAAEDLFRGWMGDNATRSDYVYAIVPSGNKGVTAAQVGGYEAYTKLADAAPMVGPEQTIRFIPKEELPPSVFVGSGGQRKVTVPVLEGDDILTWDMVGNGIGYDTLSEAKATRLADQSYDYIRSDMKTEDFRMLEEKLKTVYNQDNPPVLEVRVPDSPYADMTDEYSLIDGLFEAIGRNPSMAVVRRPFVTLRFWDNIAEEYIYSSPEVGAALKASAHEAGMGARFDRFVKGHLKTHGLDAPMMRPTPHNVDMITDLAWRSAVDDTKNLFYDLTKGGNWQDASRLVFPFADAWWEVLTRWAKLMNPVKAGGRPLKFARRVHTVMVAGEGAGYFETNSQGERVFNIPSTGALFNAVYGSGLPLIGGGTSGDVVNVNAQVSMKQLMFLDFADPSSALRPGMSPTVQVPAAWVRPLLPTFLRPAYDQVFFGDFPAPSPDPLNSAKAFLPTWIRRIVERVGMGTFDDKYASMQVQYLNALLQTPKYANAAQDRDLATEAMKEAQRAVGWIATADIFISAITPAQPRNVIELVAEDDQGNMSAMAMTALGADWAILRSVYGEDEALQYMSEMYGVNPFAIAPGTWSSLHRPVTRDSFFHLENNPDLLESAPLTLMAWLPPDDGPFYVDAWKAQQIDGSREKLSVEDATYYVGHVQGSYRMRTLRDKRDEILEKGEEAFGGRDNNAFRALRDDIVKPWYNASYADIYIQYWGYGPNSGVTGLTNRPSYKEVLGELRSIATPGTKAYGATQESSPFVHGFVQYAMEQWEANEQRSTNAGFQLTWWSTSDAQNGIAEIMRQGFQQNIAWYISGMQRQEDRDQAEWIASTIFQPLLEGFDFENPIVISPTLIPGDDVKNLSQLNERR